MESNLDRVPVLDRRIFTADPLVHRDENFPVHDESEKTAELIRVLFNQLLHRSRPGYPYLDYVHSDRVSQRVAEHQHRHH